MRLTHALSLCKASFADAGPGTGLTRFRTSLTYFYFAALYRLRELVG
jgi:hypothetical protein